MSQCGNRSSINGTYFEECQDFHLAYIYVTAICSLLFIVIALVFFVISLRSICKKKRAKIIRQSQTRGSVRRGTHGSAYNIRTQEEQLQLPEYSTRFEYVDVLAENNNSPSSQTHTTDNAITTSIQEGRQSVQREDESVLSESRHPVDYDQVYDEPDTTGLLDRRHRGRASCRSMKESLIHSGSEVDDDQHVSMRRELRARESTRSMPGIILRQASADLGKVRNSKSHKSQVVETQSRVSHNQRVRSMFDPLPDIPVGRLGGQSQMSSPLVLTEIEPIEILNKAPKVVSSNSKEDERTEESSLKRIAHDASAKQFAFEDGTFLGVDVPSFQDPEIIGENSDLKSSVSIYSSQILSKFEEVIGMDPDDKEGDTEEEEITLITSTEIETELESHFRNLDQTSDYHKTVHVTFSDDIGSIDEQRSTPEGTAVHNYSMLEMQSPSFDYEASCLVNEDEVVYDDPVLITKKQPEDENIETELSLKDIKDPANLFDYPGYAEGMMTTQQVQAITQTGLEDTVAKESPQQPESLSRKSSGRMFPSKVKFDSGDIMNTFPRRTREREKQHGSEYETEDSTQNMLSAQMREVPGLKLSLDSMAIFDFKDDELNDLDPDIATCLIDNDDDEKQISYV